MDAVLSKTGINLGRRPRLTVEEYGRSLISLPVSTCFGGLFADISCLAI
jgi:hypothetical protein